MTTITDSAPARRYLLGQASDEESTRLEQDYFADDDALDRIAAVEDDLIEDYLAGTLGAADHEHFERVYLSSARHRVRVETVRRLLAAGARSTNLRPATRASRWRGPRSHHGTWLALAASLLVLASLGLWRFSFFLGRSSDVLTHTAPYPPAPLGQDQRAPAIAVRVFTLALSPVSVRGSSYHPNTVVPAGTDRLAIGLDGDGEPRSLAVRRAVIRTIAGREVWQGPVTIEPNQPAGRIGRLDVPAASVPADDYLVTLYGTDRTGAEIEWTHYVLRIRAS